MAQPVTIDYVYGHSVTPHWAEDDFERDHADQLHGLDYAGMDFDNDRRLVRITMVLLAVSAVILSILTVMVVMRG